MRFKLEFSWQKLGSTSSLALVLVFLCLNLVPSSSSSSEDIFSTSFDDEVIIKPVPVYSYRWMVDGTYSGSDRVLNCVSGKKATVTVIRTSDGYAVTKSTILTDKVYPKEKDM